MSTLAQGRASRGERPQPRTRGGKPVGSLPLGWHTIITKMRSQRGFWFFVFFFKGQIPVLTEM